MKILLTGGLGYIGSHAATVLCQVGYEIIIYDNLSNSQTETLDSLEKLLSKRLTFVNGDVRDTQKLTKTIQDCGVEAVIHFAGLKAVGESVERPIEYYDNNVVGAISLIKAMEANGIYTLVFSSSATVYGDPQYLPLDENHPTSATNPYGQTKLQIEHFLRDISKANLNWSISILRYFNPVGAHPSGLIGENPNGIPNNLMPYIADVAAKSRPYLNIWGGDYPTVDGTGVRDYIHVMDLAVGHQLALDYLRENKGLHTFNLGTGVGYSVIEVLKTFEMVNRVSIPYQVKGRRMGDVAICYASPKLAINRLGWQAERSLEQMCIDHWRHKLLKLDGLVGIE